jgi:hypothetical protein
MSTAVSSWTCPQCQRRVPRREPLCHCGFARPSVAAAGRAGAARPHSPAGERRQGRVLVTAGVVCVLGVLVFMALRPRDLGLAAAAPVLRPQIQGPVGYPALPAAPAVKTRRGQRTGAMAGASTPNAGKQPPAVAPVIRPAPTASEQEWARAKDLLDLPLRKIAADTSVLELGFRPFEEACVDVASLGRGPARGSDWLVSLKTAPLRPGVTLRVMGATVDCATARKTLVARADALKSDLDAAEKVGRANGVLAAHWRRLLATHELDVWDRY